MIFVALILWALPFFGGLAWLRFAIGPLEARDRAGTARLYPPSNALSRERTIEVGEWVAFRRRYKSVPLATRLVLWTVRGLALLGLTAQVVNVLTPFMKSVVPH